ncbi:MAG: hypothetical protein AB7D57_06730, partial [Desulfovibrionaceae bacterium]
AGDLRLSFADPAWTGNAIPAGQQCPSDGGAGATPPLLVQDIPAEADALIFRYNDRTFTQMDNGGHGIIGLRIAPGSASVTVSAVPGNTKTLPEGFYVVRLHKGTQWGHRAGVYLPPCSGGRGNTYDVKVLAVKLTSEDGKDWDELAEGRLTLGRW